MTEGHLRKECTSLKRADIDKMIHQNNFNCPYHKITSYLQREFEVKTSQYNKVVIDNKFDLIWQKSGTKAQISPAAKIMGKLDSIDTSVINSMSWKQAKDEINKLNNKKYAGFSNWRLPTLEELMSLMKATKGNNDLYLPEEFDAEQDWCWSCDFLHGDPEVHYGVDFRYGSIDVDCLGFDTFSRGVHSSK